MYNSAYNIAENNTDSGIVRASSYSIAAWIEPYAVDVGFVAFEYLDTLACSHVPHHDGFVTALK